MTVSLAPSRRRRTRRWTHIDRGLSGRRVWYLWDLARDDERPLGRVIHEESVHRGVIRATIEVRVGLKTIHAQRIETTSRNLVKRQVESCRQRLETAVAS